MRLFFYILTKIDLFFLVLKQPEVNQRKQNLKMWGNSPSSYYSENAYVVLTYSEQGSSEKELPKGESTWKTSRVLSPRVPGGKILVIFFFFLRRHLLSSHCSQTLVFLLLYIPLLSSYYVHTFVIDLVSSDRKWVSQGPTVGFSSSVTQASRCSIDVCRTPSSICSDLPLLLLQTCDVENQGIQNRWEEEARPT